LQGEAKIGGDQFWCGASKERSRGGGKSFCGMPKSFLVAGVNGDFI
jgi:hypothetical protein